MSELGVVADSPAATSKKFGLLDKTAYASGDLANNLTFVMAAVFFLKFYTDIMGVSASLVGLVMMMSKLVDAFTDVTMGQIVDRSRYTAKGKFTPWLKRMCFPIAIATVLLFPSWFQDMPMAFKIFWLWFSYLLWGSICYTGINIPYGAMASAISDSPVDRTSLSSWRTIGATIGIVIVGVIIPLFVFYKDASGNTVLSGTGLTLSSVVCGVLMIITYLFCYRYSVERVRVEKVTTKFSFRELVMGLVTNKSLIGIVVSSLALLVCQLSLTSTGAYIYPNYFNSSTAFSVSIFLGTIITFAFTPFIVRIAQKFGKKEVSLYSSIISTVALIALYIIHTHNIYVWFVLYTIGYLGIAIFTLVCWAMITDVIDASELENGKREDGNIYSIYSFARKIGQSIASGLTGIMLSWVGYTSATAFSPKVTDGIYNVTCIVPAISSFIFIIVLWKLYPLDKKKVAENFESLKNIRKN